MQIVAPGMIRAGEIGDSRCDSRWMDIREYLCSHQEASRVSCGIEDKYDTLPPICVSQTGSALVQSHHFRANGCRGPARILHGPARLNIIEHCGPDDGFSPVPSAFSS